MPRRKTTTPSPAAIKQPPVPLISFRISPHGVSGYPTTGVAGAYNAAYSSTGIPLNNLDPAASRYDIQAGGNSITIRKAGHTYNQSTPAKLPSRATVSAFTSEPRWEARFAAADATTANLARNQRLQSGAVQHPASLLQERARAGLFGDDLFIQHQVPSMDAGVRPNQPAGDIVSPIQPTRLQFRPTPTPRQDNQPSGTINNEATIPSNPPVGQETLHDMNDAHTPQRVTAGYASSGTHPAHGPAPAQPFDGSWTLDILPGGQPLPGLMNLPPAADIPVQTYSGGGPRNTSIYYTRPSGGKFVTPTLRTVAQVSVFA